MKNGKPLPEIPGRPISHFNYRSRDEKTPVHYASAATLEEQVAQLSEEQRGAVADLADSRTFEATGAEEKSLPGIFHTNCVPTDGPESHLCLLVSRFLGRQKMITHAKNDKR